MEHTGVSIELAPEAVTAGRPTGAQAASARARRRRSAYASVGIQVASIIALIAFWWAISLAVGGARIVPTPAETLQKLSGNVQSGQVFLHLGHTLSRAIFGFSISMVIGILVGAMMGVNRLAERSLRTWIMVALTVPGLAYVVTAFIALGLNEAAAVAAVVLSSAPVIVVIIWEGVKSIDTRLTDMARSFEASASKRFFQVLLPQVLPYIIASARMGMGLIWKVVVVVELLGRNDGVGFMLYYWFQLYNMAQVFAWTAVFTAVVLLTELLIFRPLEQRLFQWRPSARL